ncbi:MAG: helix-turn-helix domain-containing protein [Actinomycetota bacterium]|nr:helix-turn-helix domain-containing protein [Actinomycetota bacterium]MDD5667084.1 helix-turn-helix domain-containing protein [Actinomycetota bacterium]
MRNYLNTHHVAKSLGVNVQTVRHYIRQGELRAARVGKRYVVTQEDIDDFLEGRKQKRSLESIGLTDKGREAVRRIKEDADRILAYLRECPGAGTSEIAAALGLEDMAAQRALRRLEARGMAYCEPSGAKPDRVSDPWHAGTGQSE